MADVRVVARDRRDMLGEGPLWSQRDNVVYWVDILDRRVNRLNLNNDQVASWIMPDCVGWVIERATQGLVAGIGRSIYNLELEPLSLRPVATLLAEPSTNRVNDAKADHWGRIWAGTMPLDGSAPSGNFYCLNPDGRLEMVETGYRIPNGPAVSPDGAFLLHTDSGLRTIFRLPIQDDGSVGRREPFLVFEATWGVPDGMTFDADGGLWVACWGAGWVTRFELATGRRHCSIPLPASQVSSCTFAGPQLDRMFVTSAAVGVDEPLAGALFEVDPGCKGLPTSCFGG